MLFNNSCTELPLKFACLVAAAFGSFAYQTAALERTTLFLSGQHAPGTADGVTFSELYHPYANTSGQIYFSGDVSGPNVTNENSRGVWRHVPQQTDLLMRAGETLPGYPELTLGPFAVPYVDSYGNWWNMPSVMVGDQTSQSLIYADGFGPPKLLAQQGQSTPIGDGSTYRFIGGAYFFDDGVPIYQGRLEGPGVQSGVNDTALFLVQNNQISPILRTGTTTPGIDNAYFTSLDNFRTNENGLFLFGGRFAGQNIEPYANDRGFWIYQNGQITLQYRSGVAAPGVADATWIDLYPIAPNRQGDLVFMAALDGPNIDYENDTGIWAEFDGQLRLVARAGELAPGAGSNQRKFYNFLNQSLLENGEIVFSASWTTGEYAEGVPVTKIGIWKYTNGQLELVAIDDQAAPGTEGGTFRIREYSVEGNASGQVAFLSNLQSLSDRGIWATDSDGSLQLVVLKGMTIDVNDDPNIVDERTVSGVELRNGAFFNDLGEVVYLLRFTDGSEGIFSSKTYNGQYGDTDGDSDVDADDLAVILSGFGSTVQPGTGGDVNRNGLIDHSDLHFAYRNWTGAEPPDNTIPEPGTLACFAMLSFLAMRRHQRHTLN